MQIATSYTGEFGYELIGVIPYAYWLYTKGLLDYTESAADTKGLYYFSPDHRELNVQRKSLNIKKFPLKWPHYPKLDKSKWLCPPYKKVYKNSRFVFDKPLYIITNKYGLLWTMKTPVNFIDYKTLKVIFNKLKDKYQIIYVRPTSKEIIEDGRPILDLREHYLIKKEFPEIILVQDLWKENQDLSFNDFQLRLFANSEKFISTQGGYAVFCSMFGGTNIIFAERGFEVKNNTYTSWYNEFSGAKIIHAKTWHDLIRSV